MDIVDIRTEKMVARAGIHVVAKWERDEFYNEVYSIETLLQITSQIISELKHPRYCFPKFVSIWPAPEVVDGIFEVCPSATKFCPLVNKPVALGFSLWWQIFDINKHFCPLVRLGPKASIASDFETLLRIKQGENENDAIRNRISNFDKWHISQPKTQ